MKTVEVIQRHPAESNGEITYRVVRLVNRTDPMIGDVLSKNAVRSLAQDPQTNVIVKEDQR